MCDAKRFWAAVRLWAVCDTVKIFSSFLACDALGSWDQSGFGQLEALDIPGHPLEPYIGISGRLSACVCKAPLCHLCWSPCRVGPNVRSAKMFTWCSFLHQVLWSFKSLSDHLRIKRWVVASLAQHVSLGGKTSTLKSLCNEAFDASEASTHGVENAVCTTDSWWHSVRISVTCIHLPHRCMAVRLHSYKVVPGCNYTVVQGANVP